MAKNGAQFLNMLREVKLEPEELGAKIESGHSVHFVFKTLKGCYLRS